MKDSRSEILGPSVVLAVLLHDVVYDPTRGDNEEASADLATKLLKEGGIDQEVGRCNRVGTHVLLYLAVFEYYGL